MYNLNSVLVELNNVCDESVIYELDKDVHDLNRRYDRISEQVKNSKAQKTLIMSSYKAFAKDCAEILAWLEYQDNLLDKHIEKTEQPSLASELALLKECEVSDKKDCE